MSVSITLKFSSGMELLLKDPKTSEFSVQLSSTTSDGSPITMKQLLEYIRDNYIQGNKELFYKEDTVRPGTIVIINESDWEVEDGPEYKLQSGDVVEFISTMHGG